MGKKSMIDARVRKISNNAVQKNSNDSKNVQEFRNFVKTNLKNSYDKAKQKDMNIEKAIFQ